MASGVWPGVDFIFVLLGFWKAKIDWGKEGLLSIGVD